MEKTKELLQVKELEVGFMTRQGYQKILDQISFCIEEGSIVGIVGESGSGKSLTSLAIMDLLAEEAVIRHGEILLHGTNLLTLSGEQRRKYKGAEISMIFQEPMTSLNPTMAIGKQVEEMLFLHGKNGDVKQDVLSMFSEVGLPTTEEFYQSYPHRLSGGMRQRVMIAMAMVTKPKLLIADEPTTALDVTVQAQILSLIRQLNEKYHTTVLFISHDLTVVRYLCSKVLIMYQGKIIEQGSCYEIFEHPQTDYTKKLLQAVPKVIRTKEELDEKQEVAATLVQKIKKIPVMLSLQQVSVSYYTPSKQLFGKKKRQEIIKNVSIEIKEGESYGIVGESGSGKSTLSKAIVGLLSIDTGKIERHVDNPQMVFQDPYSSLNPSKTIGWILEEPLRIQGNYNRAQRRERVYKMLQEVGLTTEYYDRKVSQLSGGQRQRIAIANALMNQNKFIVLDEPVSALDVTIQRQIITLLKDLKEKEGLTYLFISHDLAVVYELCDRIAVMKEGKIVEEGSCEQIYFHPTHSYAKALLDARV